MVNYKIIFKMNLFNRQGVMKPTAKNEYQDLVFLTIGCSAAIIIWKYIAQIIQKSLIGRFLALMGKESLYL